MYGRVQSVGNKVSYVCHSMEDVHFLKT